MNMEQGIGSSERGLGGRGLRRRLVVSLVAGIGALAGSAQAGPVPDYDWQWATIGDPGNAAYTKTMEPNIGEQVGSVGYKYRIARTEVTSSQWSEFATAYAPYVPEWIQNQSRFTGQYSRRRENPDGSVYYEPTGGHENVAENLGWEFAFRFANWLHNDKGTERSDFETGAYDLRVSQRGRDSFGEPIGGGIVRNPGARFFIPNEDEWIKAMYYDSNRNGPGEGGYWTYPNGSDTPLIPGYPEDGGQTDAGLDLFAPDARFLEVGSYPDVMSPWGLFDGSGGARELVDKIPQYFPDSMTTLGSERFAGSPDYWDQIETSRIAFDISLIGFRFASIVPAPSSIVYCGVLAAGCSIRRKRRSW